MITVYERWSKALAMVESNDNPDASLGDGGRAAGRWQMHPAFVDEYGSHHSALTDTWDDVYALVLANFWRRRAAAAYVGGTAHQLTMEDFVDIAMQFHLGVTAVISGEWDYDYADRFAAAWDRCEEQLPPPSAGGTEIPDR